MTIVRDIKNRKGGVFKNNNFLRKEMRTRHFNNNHNSAAPILVPSINKKPYFLPNEFMNSLGGLMAKDQSLEEGNTASVHVFVPNKKEDQLSFIEKNKDEKEKIDFSPVRLLIADDNPLIRVSLANLLNKWGILFSLCEDGLQAWEKLQEETFDMLIIDMQMPNMDGYEVIQHLRSSKKNVNNNIPIVVIAGTDDVTMIDQIKHAGVDTHILKPFKPGALFNVLVKLKNIPNYQKMRFFSDSLDQSTLEELYGNDQDHITMIFGLFLKNTPEILSQISTAFKKGDTNHLERLLHKLKPSFTMVGLNDMTTHTQQLEDKLKEVEVVSSLKEAFGRFHQEVEHTIELIEIEQEKIINK